MAATKFDRAIDLQIQIAQMAVLENILSRTLTEWNQYTPYKFLKCLMI